MLQRISNTEKVWCVEEMNGNGTLERKEKMENLSTYWMTDIKSL